MSVKSERRAWYAANVEAKPASEVAGSPVYMEWVKRANAYMVARCLPGSVELRADAVEVAPVAAVEPVEITAGGRRASASAPSADDRTEYEAFVDAQLRAFGDFTGAPGGWSDEIFDAGAIARHRGGREFVPFKGSLQSAMPYLNGDARAALDAGVIRWVTFAEFRLERAAIRAAEVEYATDYSYGDCSDCDAAGFAECACSMFEAA